MSFLFSGYVGYFSLMAAFIWLSVLAFDIWYNLKITKYQSTPLQNSMLFLCYSVYAWGLAAHMTGLVIWAQWSNLVSDDYKPGIGVEMCWLDSMYKKKI